MEFVGPQDYIQPCISNEDVRYCIDCYCMQDVNRRGNKTEINFRYLTTTVRY